MRVSRRTPTKSGRIAVALLVALAAGCRQPSGSGSVVSVVVPAPSLAANLVGEPVQQPARVYLPPSYSEGRGRFPVVYYLPGFTTEVSEYFDGTLYGWSLAEDLDHRQRAGELPEFLVVVVNGRSRLGGSFYVDSPVTGNWEAFVSTDVVDWVDAHYRTLRDRRARAVVGDSMGGSGALRLAMRHADRFASAYALSPGLFAPGGLEASGIWSRHRRRATAWWRAGLRRDPRLAAVRELPDLTESLLASHEMFAYRLTFDWAYLAAFGPEVAATLLPGLEGGAPSGAAAASNPERLREVLEAGFGDLDRRVTAHATALRSLAGLGLDCGRNDRLSWIPRGCQYLADLLAASGVPHVLRYHDGGHIDRLPERLGTVALPFVAERLMPAARSEAGPR